jgi:hypothetical protein
MLCPTSEKLYELDVRHFAFSCPPSICTLFFLLIISIGAEPPPMQQEIFSADVSHSPIPALNDGGFPGLPIPACEVSTHAKVLRLRQVLPQLAYNAAVDIAFPIRQQGRHPKEVISELNPREACLRFPLPTQQPLCYHNHRVVQGIITC